MYEKKSYIYKAVIIAILISVIFTVCYEANTQAAQLTGPPNALRVALSLNQASANFQILEGNYQLIDYVTNKVLGSGPGIGSWVVAPAGKTNIQVSYNGKKIGNLGSSLYLKQVDYNAQNIFRYKNVRYRGDLLIQNINGKIQIIDVVDVEQYLYGVVGAEIGMSAPDEALKAQAVVSRTYALYYKEHPQLHYDLGIGTQWQVYGGYDTELLTGERVKSAVNATKGQAIYYDNKLILAFFHANSGGFTEACENVWYSSIPYIQPVSSPGDAQALNEPQNQGWPAVTYQWEKSFTTSQIAQRITQWNRGNSDDKISVGTIKDITASRQAIDPVTHKYLPRETTSKRVTQLNFVGSIGTKSIFRDRIRNVFDLRSTLFEICTDSTVHLWTAFNTKESVNRTENIRGITVDGLVSKLNGNNRTYYIVTSEGVKTMPKTFSKITFSGNGYGHGLGMSQWGARGMAVSGSHYQNIIQHYYNQDRNDGRLVIGTYNPEGQNT